MAAAYFIAEGLFSLHPTVTTTAARGPLASNDPANDSDNPHHHVYSSKVRKLTVGVPPKILEVHLG